MECFSATTVGRVPAYHHRGKQDSSDGYVDANDFNQESEGIRSCLVCPFTGKADDSRCRIMVQVSRIAFDSTAPNLMSHHKRNELATTRMKPHEVVSTEGTLWMDFLVSVVRFRSDSVGRLRSAPDYS